MSMRINPIVPLKGEAGELLAAGVTVTVGDAFGALVCGDGRALDVDGVLLPAQRVPVTYDQRTGGLYAGASPVSGAGNSAAPTEFPAERVTMAATGCVCASPCALVRIRCVSGAAVALVVYDNPAASSGTQLYSGTLSAGQEAAISTPVRAINGLRAVFASGSFDFYVSQEA